MPSPLKLDVIAIVRPELRLRLRLRQNPAILAGFGSGLPPAPVILAGFGSGLAPAPVVSETLNNRRMLTGVSNHIFWYLSYNLACMRANKSTKDLAES